MGKIEAKNIVKYFQHDGKPLKAIGGVNLTVNDGEFVCIVGPSAVSYTHLTLPTTPYV